MTKTVVLTGAQGLLGRAVANLASARGWNVIVLGRNLAETSLGVQAAVADLAQDWSVSVLPSRADAVVHLAQSNRFREFPEQAMDIFGVNVASTAKLLDYARKAGAGQFIYASTGGVYSPGPGRLDENAQMQAPQRLGAYFGSKVSGEILVQSYSAVFTTTILRPFFVYGAGQKRDMHLPRMFDRVSKGEPIQLHGPGGIRINPVHAADAAEAVVAAIAAPLSAVVNIAGPEALSIREIAEAFGRHCGRAPAFEQMGQPGLDLVADISLMRSRLHVPTRRLFDSLDDIAV